MLHDNHCDFCFLQIATVVMTGKKTLKVPWLEGEPVPGPREDPDQARRGHVRRTLQARRGHVRERRRGLQARRGQGDLPPLARADGGGVRAKRTPHVLESASTVLAGCARGGVAGARAEAG